MSNAMRQIAEGLCHQNTEMPLSLEDLLAISALGRRINEAPDSLFVLPEEIIPTETRDDDAAQP